MKTVYFLGVFLFGIISFVSIWIYSMTTWGLLLGLIFGWIPALIGGFIIGYLWPIFLIGAWLIYSYYQNNIINSSRIYNYPSPTISTSTIVSTPKSSPNSNLTSTASRTNAPSNNEYIDPNTLPETYDESTKSYIINYCVANGSSNNYCSCIYDHIKNTYSTPREYAEVRNGWITSRVLPEGWNAAEYSCYLSSSN